MHHLALPPRPLALPNATVTWALLALAACACSENSQNPVSSQAGSDTFAGDAALLDAPLSDSALTDTALAHTDSQPSDAVWAGAELAGTYQDCRGTLTLSADGAADWYDERAQCHVKGAWLLAADPTRLAFSLAAQASPTCAPPSFMSATTPYFQAADRLVLQPPGSPPRALGKGAVQRQRWDVLAGTGVEPQQLKAELRACFLSDGVYFDGWYRSLDANCTFLSCSGGIANWQHKAATDSHGEQTHIWTTCAGTCPCAGLIVANATATKMAGSWAAVSCTTNGGAQSADGTFSAMLVAF